MKKAGTFFSKVRSLCREYIKTSLKGWLIFFSTLGVASAICAMLMRTTTSDVHVPLIFVLAVLIISLSTDGYFYGFLAAFVSVVFVNFAFTFPYLKLDFTIYGYPLTFMTMLAVGFATSTLTARLKAQEKLHMESEREKMRANLLRAISHDLRTPLTAISGSISTVLEGDEVLTKQQKNELLLDAKKDAEWLCRMVENLLSITRMNGADMGGITKNDEILEEVLSEAVMAFKKRHDDVPVSVSVSVPDTMIFLPMDAMLIEQVLINLMDNAVVHGGNVSQIKINAREEDGKAIVSVADNGRGIDAETLPHLFDGSLQLSGNKSADTTRSMGIGLSVCKTIVAAHEGDIYAENLPEGGAMFTFTLPLGGTSYDNQG